MDRRHAQEKDHHRHRPQWGVEQPELGMKDRSWLQRDERQAQGIPTHENQSQEQALPAHRLKGGRVKRVDAQGLAQQRSGLPGAEHRAIDYPRQQAVHQRSGEDHFQAQPRPGNARAARNERSTALSMPAIRGAISRM